LNSTKAACSDHGSEAKAKQTTATADGAAQVQEVAYLKRLLCHLTGCRSGKSSITSVVFHKMPPQETLFLESTTRIQKDSMQ
jgi:Ras-related GTP-binding protein C/D